MECWRQVLLLLPRFILNQFHGLDFLWKTRAKERPILSLILNSLGIIFLEDVLSNYKTSLKKLKLWFKSKRKNARLFAAAVLIVFETLFILDIISETIKSEGVLKNNTTYYIHF